MTTLLTQPLPRELGRNEGHGHVFKRTDGILARCGGPAFCTECAKDLARWHEDHKGPGGFTDCLLCTGTPTALERKTPPSGPQASEQVFRATAQCVDAISKLGHDSRLWVVHYLDRLTKGEL